MDDGSKGQHIRMLNWLRNLIDKVWQKNEKRNIVKTLRI